jgi:putative transcriptional regulator
VKNAVRELRTARGLSQSDLGAALRVSRQTINAIETGRYLPSLPLALRLGTYTLKLRVEIDHMHSVNTPGVSGVCCTG